MVNCCCLATSSRRGCHINFEKHQFQNCTQRKDFSLLVRNDTHKVESRMSLNHHHYHHQIIIRAILIQSWVSCGSACLVLIIIILILIQYNIGGWALCGSACLILIFIIILILIQYNIGGWALCGSACLALLLSIEHECQSCHQRLSSSSSSP